MESVGIFHQVGCGGAPGLKPSVDLRPYAALKGRSSTMIQTFETSFPRHNVFIAFRKFIMAIRFFWYLAIEGDHFPCVLSD